MINVITGKPVNGYTAFAVTDTFIKYFGKSRGYTYNNGKIYKNGKIVTPVNYIKDIPSILRPSSVNPFQPSIGGSTLSEDSGIVTPFSISDVQKQQLDLLLSAYYSASNDAQRRESLNNIVQFFEGTKQEIVRQENYERSLPITQFNNLIAAGLSPTAARAALVGANTNSSYTPVTTTSQAPSQEELALQTAQTVLGSITGIAGLFGSAIELGVNLPAMIANADIAQYNAQVAQQDFEGIQAANSFSKAFTAAGNAGFAMNSVDNVLEAIPNIISAADQGDIACSDFVSNYLETGAFDTIYARQHANDFFNNKTDNELYRNNAFANLMLQEVSYDKLFSEIINNRAEFDKIVSDTALNYRTIANFDVLESYQKAQTSVARGQAGLLKEQIQIASYTKEEMALDLERYSAEFDKIKDIELTELANKWAVISRENKEGKRISLVQMLNDQNAMVANSYVACLFAQGGQEYVKQLKNSGNERDKQLLRIYGVMSNPNIHQAFQGIATQSDVQGDTYTEGSNFLGKSFTVTRRTKNAMFMDQLIFGK